jgi:hypothetical protein
MLPNPNHCPTTEMDSFHYAYTSAKTRVKRLRQALRLRGRMFDRDSPPDHDEARRSPSKHPAI